MIISVVFVSMMVVFVTVYHFVTKPKKQQEKIYSAMTTDELMGQRIFLVGKLSFKRIA